MSDFLVGLALIGLMFIGIVGDCIKATPEEWEEESRWTD